MAAEPLLAISFFLLILPFSSPSFSPIFLACGSSSSVNFTSDTPPRTFTPDGEFLLSSSNSKTDSFSGSSVSPLYTTARLFTSSSSYSFEVDPDAFYILRLHFFPFNSTSNAQFNVSAMERYLLLSSFSPSPSKLEIKEFFLWINTSTVLLTFSPSPNNLAFINALELISSPPNLINASRPVYTTPSSNSQDDTFSPQATETLYRVNIGGQLITPANDTLWRTWETDDYHYLFDKKLSVENSTTGRIEYPIANGLTRSIAPEMVYSTARTLNNSTGMSNPLFNLTWSFNVPPGFQYLIRMHFCNCWFPSSNFYFQVYIGDLLARKNLEPGSMTNWRSMIPFYYDFVVDAPVSGPLNVSIEPAANSEPPNALLNGLEIMKLSNSHLSLADEFGLSENDTRSHAGKRLFSILLISIIGGVVTLAVLLYALLLCLRRRGSRRRQQQIQNPAEEQKDMKHTTSWSQYSDGVLSAWSKSSTHETQNNSASSRFNLGLQICFAEVNFATNNFDEKLLIGAGGFGKVYRGVLYDGTKVAVKRGVPGSRQGYPEFQTEVVFLSRIRHRHLVSLIGYCEENSELILVYEYMEKGTLRSYLYGSDLPCLSWKQRLEICICAARGLHYLHTGYSQSIIHRDVKSTNILLGENFIAKVSDFGLSRLGPSFGETHVSTNLKGTFGYFDPEYVKIMKLTEKSDIYSFGVVLFEVLCARPPIVDHVNLAELALHWLKKGQLEKIVDQRLAGKMNENSLRKFGETAAKCLADYGRDRPSIGDVLWNLEYALQLQVTQLSREPFEDSGMVDESQIAVVESVRRYPSAETVSEEELAASSSSSKEITSTVFSQLVTGEGR